MLNELAQTGVVFDAGLALDARADVHAVGLRLLDGFGDVFGREPAGQQDAPMTVGGAGLAPVESLAGAAALAFDVGVEKKSGSARVVLQLLRAKLASDAKGFHNLVSLGGERVHVGR